MQERWIKRRSSESLAGCGVEGDRLSQETSCYVCNRRLGLEGLFPNPSPLSRQMYPVWVLWTKYRLIFFTPQTGLGDNTAGTDVQVPIQMRDRKRNSDLFSVLDGNRLAAFGCSCIFCTKQLRPLVVQRRAGR